MSATERLADVLKDSTRPVFLFGSTPPREGTSEEKAKEACAKFAARSAVLATDGFIVYDIQDEAGRTKVERPFPFRKTMDPAWYASLFPSHSGKECVVYKSVCENTLEEYGSWLDQACDTFGHETFTLVGAPSSTTQLKGPTLVETMNYTKNRVGCSFGCVCIPERHVSKGNEHQNMIRKSECGAQWFITQGIYSTTPVVQLLTDYGALCKEKGVTPKKVVLTFAPCGRTKTMTFIKWLGMEVPSDVEQRILESTSPVQESFAILKEILSTILLQTAGSGVPIGINVESLSIFKEEIDVAHELFQSLQAILLTSRGSPWSVRWFCVRHAMSHRASQISEQSLVMLETRSHRGESIDYEVEKKSSTLSSYNGREVVTTGMSSGSVVLSMTIMLALGVLAGRQMRN